MLTWNICTLAPVIYFEIMIKSTRVRIWVDWLKLGNCRGRGNPPGSRVGVLSGYG